MSTRLFLIIYLIVALPIYGIGMYLSHPSRMPLFYCCEILFVLNIVFGIVFFRRVMRPLDVLQGGMALLKTREWNVSLSRVGQPEADAVVDVFNNMISRLHSLNVTNAEQRHFLALLVEACPVGIIVCGFDGVIKTINPYALQFITASCGDQLAGTDGELARRLSALEPSTSCLLRLADGHILSCTCRRFMENGVSNTFYIIENITEAVGLAEKEAYGKLIRVISHEVNNSVAGLTTAMEMIGELLPEDMKRAGVDSLVASCSDRAKSLSSFIGRFAQVVKLPEPSCIELNLSAFIESMRPFLESMCSSRNINFRLETADSGPLISADPVMLEQVMINVVKNACESIGRDGNVSIYVSETAPELTVTDDGPGIPPGKAEMMFVPFYTDKPEGQGIGLTLVREILRRHNAGFDLSTSGGLTRFSVTFPYSHTGGM